MIKTARITTSGVMRALWVLALLHPWGWLARVNPVCLTWATRRSLCTPMHKQYLQKTRPAYAEHLQRVPAFLPWRTQ